MSINCCNNGDFLTQFLNMGSYNLGCGNLYSYGNCGSIFNNSYYGGYNYGGCGEYTTYGGGCYNNGWAWGNFAMNLLAGITNLTGYCVAARAMRAPEKPEADKPDDVKDNTPKTINDIEKELNAAYKKLGVSTPGDAEKKEVEASYQEKIDIIKPEIDAKKTEIDTLRELSDKAQQAYEDALKVVPAKAAEVLDQLKKAADDAVKDLEKAENELKALEAEKLELENNQRAREAEIKELQEKVVKLLEQKEKIEKAEKDAKQAEIDRMQEEAKKLEEANNKTLDRADGNDKIRKKREIKNISEIDNADIKDIIYAFRKTSDTSLKKACADKIIGTIKNEEVKNIVNMWLAKNQ